MTLIASIPPSDTPEPTLPVENGRFFLQQYSKTLPLNAFSMLLSVLNWALWVMLDNSKLLGVYSLAGTPSSMAQQSLCVSTLAQPLFPNIKSKDQERAIVQVALKIDTLLMGMTLLGILAFFLITHANIISNLGLLSLVGVCILPLGESIVSIAMPVCNARRLYGWNFALNNIRPLIVILFLSVLWVLHITQPSFGLWIWGLSTVSAFVLGGFFLVHYGLHPLSSTPGHLKDDFRKNVRQNVWELAVYRVGVLIFASLPSLFITFIPNTKDIGLFSFAMALSGFFYSALAPINEQVYSPSYSRLIYAQNAQLLFRRIFQMILITLAASIPCVTCIFLFGEPFLNFIHKAAFKDSFVFLPALLAYRILSMTVTGFSYSILCMNRFKALGILYLTSSLVAGIGYLLLRQNLILRVWCLPLATVTLGFLSCAYIIWLIRSKHPLLRRAMHTTV